MSSQSESGTKISNPEELTESKKTQSSEPLITDPDNRHVLLPIRHRDLWNLYKQAQASYWTVEEIDLKNDYADFKTKLTENERTFIKNILAFFAASDFIVNDNLFDRFIQEVNIPEAKCFYGFQTAIESVHCVVAETQILTETGYRKIGDLVDQTISVWNGKKFSKVEIVQTSEASEIYKVTLSNGMELDCTDGHKWIMRSGKNNSSEQRVITKDLKADDEIAKYDFPVLDISDPDEFLNPYLYGVLCGEENSEEDPGISPMVDRGNMARFFRASTKHHEKKYNQNCEMDPGESAKSISFVPMNYSIHTKMRWLEGLCDASGRRQRNPKSTIQITSKNGKFMRDVQLLLTTLGVHSNTKTNLTKSGESACRILEISAADVNQLIGRGFRPKHLEISTRDVKSRAPRLTVKSVVSTQRTSPTFCFNEPERHMGVFNGILTGQSETYALLLDTLIRDPKEKDDALHAVERIPCIQRKAEWAKKWIADTNASFAKRLVCFAIVEGLHFSGSFCALYWLKKRNIMHGVTFSNNLIARDEGLHTEFATVLYGKCRNRLTSDEMYEIMDEAVKIEKEFICESIPCAFIGMSGGAMSTYIEFVADRLLKQLGYAALYNARNPFDFMEMISIQGKQNFFEGRTSEYSKAFVNVTDTGKDLNMDVDF